MIMKKIFKKLISSGILIQPFVLIAILILIHLNKLDYWLDVRQNWSLIITVSFIPVVYMWLDDLGSPTEKRAFKGKEKNQYPKVNKAMLSDKPKGVIFGKDVNTNKYVVKDEKADGNVMILGGTGSGKSSCFILDYLVQKDKKAACFVIDIKGELSFKSTMYGDSKIHMFNPQDRYSYGYNPFYMLNEDSNNQKILECMQLIAFSLIPMPANITDPFWKNSARNLLTGFLIYFYNQGFTNFISIIDEILSKPIQVTIQKIVETANPTSSEYRYIIQFSGMAEETLGGIQSEVINHILLFSNDADIRYAMRDNPNIVNPLMLNNEESIYLVLKEEKLSAYYDLLQLVVNQVLAMVEQRDETKEELNYIYVILDEFARLVSQGKLAKIYESIKTMRSKNTRLVMVSQSIDALLVSYSEPETNDILSNCSYIVVLQATTSKTQKQIVEWCGKFKERKTSWNGEGKSRKASVSYNEQAIISESDLMTLTATGDAILISPYGYNRVKKVPYYKDKYLAPLSKECVEFNKKYLSDKEKL